jgi:hypothetical protein
MNTKVTAIFTDHPSSVGESYFEHMLFASKFSLKMAGGAIAALIHALLPFLFVSTASEMIAEMHNRNQRRFGRD